MEKPKIFDAFNVIRMFYKTWPTKGENMTSGYTKIKKKEKLIRDRDESNLDETIVFWLMEPPEGPV